MPACVLHGKGFGPCGGRLHDHHIVPQARIKSRHATLRAAFRRGGPKPWPLSRALKDPRLIVDACAYHHLGPIEDHRRARIEERDLPAGIWDAVAEYDLWGELKGTPLEALDPRVRTDDGAAA